MRRGGEMYISGVTDNVAPFIFEIRVKKLLTSYFN